MTTQHLSDELIRSAIARRVTDATEGDLRERVLAATATASQRRGWVAGIGEALERPDRRRAIVAMAAVALLVASLAAIALVGGPARDPVLSGRGIVFISNGGLYVAGPRGEAARIVVADLPGLPSRPMWVDAETVVVQGTPGGVYAINLGTPFPRLLEANGQLLALSPDHTRIAIGLDRPDGPHVSIVEIASGLKVADIVVRPAFAFPATPQIGPQEGLTGGPHAWSPDGRWLLGQGLDTDESATSGWIYQLDIQTGEIRDLETDLCCGLNQPNPVLSPDGSRVVYVNYHQAGRGDICGFRCGTLWSVELATGVRTQLTPDAGSEIGPVFSPDGTWVAFLDDDAGVGFEIAIIRPDGTGLRKLTNSADSLTDAADAFAPRGNLEPYRYLFWDADGTGLTFMRGPGESHELWHVTVDGPVELRLGTVVVSEFAT